MLTNNKSASHVMSDDLINGATYPSVSHEMANDPTDVEILNSNEMESDEITNDQMPIGHKKKRSKNTDDDVIQLSNKEAKQSIKKQEITIQVQSETISKQFDMLKENTEKQEKLYEDNVKLMRDKHAAELENKDLKFRLQATSAAVSSASFAASSAVRVAANPAAASSAANPAITTPMGTEASAANHPATTVPVATAASLCKSFARQGLIEIVQKTWIAAFKGFEFINGYETKKRMGKMDIAQFIIDNGLAISHFS